MRPLCSFLLLIIAAQASRAYTVVASKTDSRPIASICSSKRLNFKDAVDNAVSYNAVYKWTRGGGVEHWRYTRPVRDSNGMLCATFHYQTQLQVPHAFEAFAPKLSLTLKIDKEVCANSTVIQEDNFIHSNTLLRDVRTKITYRQDDETLRTRLQLMYELPWLGMFLQNKITEHIMRKSEQKLHLLTTQLCA